MYALVYPSMYKADITAPVVTMAFGEATRVCSASTAIILVGSSLRGPLQLGSSPWVYEFIRKILRKKCAFKELYLTIHA